MPSTTTDADGALFEQLRPRLKAISRRIVGNEAEAEDVVQDCYFKWQAASQAALATPAAWLTTVVQHQSLDRLRKRARDAVAARAALELVPEAPCAPPDGGLLRRAELEAGLVRLLTCLSPSERLALVLHEVLECEHADIAAALGTSSANARQHLARARRRLRRSMEDGQETPAGEKLSRELVRRFQAAINGADVPAVVTLLGDGQPVSVRPPRMRAGGCANDACYSQLLAA
nr:sigma-70 family RNA polymerase sigma factor [uncultured Duganella sp.]